ncbi:cellulase family glycosylhydrolase [Flavobacterium sp. ST-87]|uniref:Cellulase family glycosylhydrolase n=1 Tax=Flavobacterium plantiphilum TaxID=3163297 RepID=A0ABW8XVK9_9FLAO
MKLYKILSIQFAFLLFFSCSKDDTPKTSSPKDDTPPAEETISWPLSTPKLKVVGKYLKDPCGNIVKLHGVAMTPSPWFNGGAVEEWRWNNYDVAGCLTYNKAVMNKLSDAKQGWYLNYVRLHIDPYWTNNPGVSGIQENDISQFNFERFKSAIDNVILPLITYAKSKGMYIILRPPGVCPEEIAVGDAYHDYLKLVWDYISKHSSLKNSDHVMFELANEPIRVKLPDNSVGANTQAHFDQLKLFFQPIVNMIRANGANNILWIPGSGWQSQYKGYAVNPIEGENIGYAVHIYPGYWGLYNGSTWKGQTVEVFQGGRNGAPLQYATKTSYYLKKYMDESINLQAPNVTSKEHTWVLFRYAEVLLNYAEAMNEIYGPDNGVLLH